MLFVLLLWAVLRGRKQWFRKVAWTYEIVCLMEYTSALWLVPADELRLLWFFVNIPGVFILLGNPAGWLITAFTVVWLIISNQVMPAPYSGNAMASREGALQLAEAARQAVEALNPSIGDKNLRVTASIGVAHCNSFVEGMQAIQQRADKAMYVAKSQGRNRVSALDE